METASSPSLYRGRIAPTPTGEFHLGHARTFDMARRRAEAAGGDLILRLEDLDENRCKPEYVEAMFADLAWMGIRWQGEPIYQSKRRAVYLNAWHRLKEEGFIYPCTRSRKEFRSVARAPHEDEEAAEPIYPPEWRPPPGAERAYDHPQGVNWRFRVSEGEVITFSDARKGEVSFVAGVDFGDFGVWNREDIPAYELAVVVDDLAGRITEVVRGEDLLKSTARQILLYRALGGTPPAWCHEPLVRDEQGRRLAKRCKSMALRVFREQGLSFADLQASQNWRA
ncbi:MAG: tRNA glutamyl-Q synthetase [Verrucomicrobia bacterium]|nr:tRNA glutamyl-Q synthetase [Verrucomicrobiota bacterium]